MFPGLQFLESWNAGMLEAPFVPESGLDAFAGNALNGVRWGDGGQAGQKDGDGAGQMREG